MVRRLLVLSYRPHVTTCTFLLLARELQSHRALADGPICAKGPTDTVQVPKQLLPNIMTSFPLRGAYFLHPGRDMAELQSP